MKHIYEDKLEMYRVWKEKFTTVNNLVLCLLL